jgi:hypothetical protein
MRPVLEPPTSTTTCLAAWRDGGADLLVEVAGILEGAAEGELDEPSARQAAGLCRKAEADPEAIPGMAGVFMAGAAGQAAGTAGRPGLRFSCRAS